MNNLVRLYDYIKTFSEDHKMVNEFIMVGSEDEINDLVFNYRTLVMMPLEASLSRELNSPIYTLGFSIIVIDKIPSDNEIAYIMSSEENINVIGQLQDHLLQNDLDVSFDNVELSSGMSKDYNVTIAMADFSVNLSRGTYRKDINI